ncbi:small integral membrane protein 30 isoform X1 [Corvus cornix cornix]|nr:small integral membrane protein 30 isoform X1 [Corvus cornix cornix]
MGRGSSEHGHSGAPAQSRPGEQPAPPARSAGRRPAPPHPSGPRPAWRAPLPGPPAGPGAALAAGSACAPEPHPGITASTAARSRRGRRSGSGAERSEAERRRPGRVTPAPGRATAPSCHGRGRAVGARRGGAGRRLRLLSAPRAARSGVGLSPEPGDTTEISAVHHFPHLTSPCGQLVVSMPSTENTSKLFLVLVSLLLVLPVVEALDAGDTIAFLLGLAVSVVGFCACLGLYARRRNGQQ